MLNEPVPDKQASLVGHCRSGLKRLPKTDLPKTETQVRQHDKQASGQKKPLMPGGRVKIRAVNHRPTGIKPVVA